MDPVGIRWFSDVQPIDKDQLLLNARLLLLSNLCEGSVSIIRAILESRVRFCARFQAKQARHLNLDPAFPVDLVRELRGSDG